MLPSEKFQAFKSLSPHSGLEGKSFRPKMTTKMASGILFLLIQRDKICFSRNRSCFLSWNIVNLRFFLFTHFNAICAIFFYVQVLLFSLKILKAKMRINIQQSINSLETKTEKEFKKFISLWILYRCKRETDRVGAENEWWRT